MRERESKRYTDEKLFTVVMATNAYNLNTQTRTHTTFLELC